MEDNFGAKLIVKVVNQLGIKTGITGKQDSVIDQNSAAPGTGAPGSRGIWEVFGAKHFNIDIANTGLLSIPCKARELCGTNHVP